MKQTNPELDLLIMESLDTDFKPASAIAEEAHVEEDIVVQILDELTSQGMAIEKKGTSYRVASDDE